MAQNTLYRFALLSYLPDLKDLIWPSAVKSEYTLDYFVIPYEKADLGVSDLLAQGYDVVLIYSTFGFSAIKDGGYSVVNIQKTDMDIIQALLHARAESSVVGLPVHVNENVDTALLGQLCGVKLHKIPFGSKSELDEGVFDSLNQGIRTFVGGGFIAVLTQYSGSKCFHIAPSQRNVENALRQAVVVAQAKRQERIKNEELMAVFKLFDTGVLYIDGDRNCIYSNRMATNLLKVDSTLGSAAFTDFYKPLMLDEVLSGGEARLEHIVSLGKKQQLVVSTLPVSIYSEKQGAVAFFRDVAALHDFAGRVRATQVHGFVARNSLNDIKGDSHDMARFKRMLNIYAPYESPILIQGETGTGKDLAAQAIHNASQRRDMPFVAINCAALPETLLESELFGYEEGAFTGARRGGKAGIFELAHTGTLFLDEVGDLGHNAQLRLLRVLESKEIFRVGGNRTIAVDIRILSASHKSLSQLVQAGQFRADLFYRLAVLRLQIPPLRKRMDDLPLLLGDLFARYGRTLKSLTPAILTAISSYRWPGNVRELRSVVESYLIMLEDKDADEELFIDMFREWTHEQSPEEPAKSAAIPALPALPALEEDFSGDLKGMMHAARRRIVLNMVEQCGQNRNLAASRLGISYNTLWRILSDQ